MNLYAVSETIYFVNMASVKWKCGIAFLPSDLPSYHSDIIYFSHNENSYVAVAIKTINR